MKGNKIFKKNTKSFEFLHILAKVLKFLSYQIVTEDHSEH